MLNSLKSPPQNKIINLGKSLNNEEINKIINEYIILKQKGFSKKYSIEKLSEIYGRGYWSILKMINRLKDKGEDKKDDLLLFDVDK